MNQRELEDEVMSLIRKRCSAMSPGSYREELRALIDAIHVEISCQKSHNGEDDEVPE